MNELTGVTWEECHECYQLLWRVFKEKYPQYSSTERNYGKNEVAESPANMFAVFSVC